MGFRYQWGCGRWKPGCPEVVAIRSVACPHCGQGGTIVLHGFLYGTLSGRYGGSNAHRGRRFYCSNRRGKRGCGRSFSVMEPDVLPGFCLSTTGLWVFLCGFLSHPLASMNDPGQPLEKQQVVASGQSKNRLIKRLFAAQARIRGCLGNHSPPMEMLHSSSIADTAEHLRRVFPKASDPVAAFQERFQASFL